MMRSPSLATTLPRWEIVCFPLAFPLALLETNPSHPGLNTHKFSSLKGPGGEDVFEAYAENKTPAAWRVFWYYGPDKRQITILAITPHP